MADLERTETAIETTLGRITNIARRNMGKELTGTDAAMIGGYCDHIRQCLGALKTMRAQP